MYAVIESGGKQYRVEQGEVLDVELLSSVGEDGAVEFDRVLLIGGNGEARVGAPTVAGAKVRAKVLDAVRGPKIRVFKTKKRKGFRRTNGHRQHLHRVRIEEIGG
ncbi:MAG: 50S ribosomal protein L21 [Thermoanaerobaculia bacterium]